jgi:hypothetical protein
MSAKPALLGLIAFLLMVGAVAMLTHASTQNGFVISGIVGAGDSDAAALPVHSTHLLQYTKMIPSGWIHNTLKGTGNTTGGVGAASYYVPPTGVHQPTGNDASIWFDPVVFKHASIPGPDFTKLIPIDWVHNALLNTTEYTQYAPPGTSFHIASGPDMTQNSPNPGHYSGGPNASQLRVSPGEVYHISDGPQGSGYRGPDAAHVTSGGAASTWVDKAFHLATGSDKSKLDSTQLIHISSGVDKTKLDFPPFPKPSTQPTPTPAPPAN